MSLSEIYEAVDEVLTIEKAIEDAEHRLAEAKQRVRTLTHETIPDLMLAEGVNTLTTDTGLSLTIEPFITGNIPSATSIERARGEEEARLIERKTNAFSWLRANQHDGIIKNVVSVAFGKGQDQQAQELLVKLRGEMQLPAEQNESVHHSTLQAWLRECVNKRKLPIPFDLFAVEVGRRVVIEKQKEA